MKTVEVALADGSVLCRAQVADNPLTRGVGLLGRGSLSENEGLLITPCTSVHTMFMRFPIDVLYLSSENTVVKVVRMRAFRFSMGGRGAKKVLELSFNSADRRQIRVGDSLSFSHPS